MYVRAAAERSLSGTPMHLLLLDAPNRVNFMDENFHAGKFPCRTGAFMRFRLFVPYGRDIASFRRALWPYKRDTEWHNMRFHGSTSIVLQHRSLQHHPAYNTTRVFEQWSIFNPASAVRDAPAHVPQALLSPLLPTASVTPYLLRSSNPSANFFARPSARTFPFLLDFDLRETFFRRPPSRVLSFGRLQYRHFLDDFNTVWPSGDLYHNLHIFSSGLFLLGSLRSRASPNIVCYGNWLFSVSV